MLTLKDLRVQPQRETGYRATASWPSPQHKATYFGYGPDKDSAVQALLDNIRKHARIAPQKAYRATRTTGAP